MGQCYASDLIPKEELKEVLELAEMGVETIRFSVAMNLDEFSRQIESARGDLRDLGNPPLSVHGPFLDLNPMSFDSRVRQVTKERFEQAYEAARILGADRVVYHSGLIPATVYLEGWAVRMVEFWEEFLKGKSGITVCMENVFDPEYSGLLEVAEKISHPDFGLCLDIGHAHCFSEHPVLEWAERLSGHIRHVHVHDNDGSCDAHRALGRGNIPLDEVLPALERGNPGLTWTVECTKKEDILESGRLLHRKLQFM